MRWEENMLSSAKSITDIYEEFIKDNRLQDRLAIRQTVEELEKGHNVILKAPTGYGKTTLTKVLANAVDLGYFARVIHVLPLRAIVQDLYEKLKSDSEKGVIRTKSIAAQDMDFSDSPFFMQRVTVTTLDTFILNLFKLPAVEMGKVFQNFGAHYELPRGMIYSSLVIFDEFHLLGEEGRPLTAGLSAVKSLTDAGVPVIIMSATIDKGLESLIMKYGKDFVTVEAKDFSIERKITVKKIREEEVLSDVLKEYSEGKRVLVVFNTRVGAINFYKALKDKGLNPVLIHSKFNREDRRVLVQKVLKERLVVSTQVIEAGIDTSFDVLITEAAPASNLIQRAGRVARYGGYGEVHVFPFSGKVYDKEEVQEVWESLDRGLPELKEKEYHVDNILLSDLTTIDHSVFADSITAKNLYTSVCNIVRETSIIMGFPRGEYNSEKAIPLTEKEAMEALRKNGAVKDGKEVTDYKPSTNVCLQLDLLMKGIDGVIIAGYDKEIGGII
ncbi:putative CRISPR-associated helicase Cas3 [Sulfurisphaera tokodaii str. 7]|uniref:CRISPR-associated helicase Cas3 n=3 Tax=Sulfurisphaera tokodaii TaxID=111955 RepID=F9VPJ3_SULTO|nr:putative CRISPR-associated helicase Cas3 [Sulfurisphaera tokodaii str. 7]HII75284.1 CRISPR-associated helicase Cas3' [Sulfurisphaera tokodaii]